MPTYVSLIHWTDQGIKNYKEGYSGHSVEVQANYR